jgi:ATP-binding cassette subfamily F protein 3
LDDDVEVFMLTVHQLAKSFALKTLFENVTFSINTGDRVGLVGPNGCGKTTLLRAITGEVQADSGHVTRNNGLRVGYLSQGFEYSARETIGEVIGKASGDVEFLESELTILSTALADKPDDRDLQYRYDALLHKIGFTNASLVARILAGLDLDKVPANTPVEILSGGQQTRLNLALVLMDDPQLLLLDEPTNHLDIGMLEWLENWLSAFHGGALIVSHDRIFLDNSVNRVLAIDPLRKELREFAGNYSAYQEQIRLERDKQWELYRDQQQEERRIKQDILRAKAQAAYTERQASSVRIGGEMMKLKGYKDYQQGIAKKVAKKAKSRERKLDRYLDSHDRVDKPRQSHDIRLDFSETEHLGRSVVTVSDLCVGYDGHDPLLDGLNLEAQPGARIVLAGPNGGGKTTFLKTLTGQIPAQSGNVIVGPSVKLGFMTQDQADIDLESTPLGSLRHAFNNETKTRTYLGYFLFVGDEALLDNRSLSFGQRARLALAQLVASGCNVLLLDEPINHLDIPAREKFEEALSGFSGTIIAVIHDRYFIDRFATEIWEVRDRGIRRVLR